MKEASDGAALCIASASHCNVFLVRQPVIATSEGFAGSLATFLVRQVVACELRGVRGIRKHINAVIVCASLNAALLVGVAEPESLADVLIPTIPTSVMFAFFFAAAVDVSELFAIAMHSISTRALVDKV